MICTKNCFQSCQAFKQLLFCPRELSHPCEVPAVVKPVTSHLPVIVELYLLGKLNGLAREVRSFGQSALCLSQASHLPQPSNGLRMILPQDAAARGHCLPQDQIGFIELALNPKQRRQTPHGLKGVRCFITRDLLSN